MSATLKTCGLLTGDRLCHCASGVECQVRDQPEFPELRRNYVDQMEREKQAAHGYGPGGYAATLPYTELVALSERQKFGKSNVGELAGAILRKLEERKR